MESWDRFIIVFFAIIVSYSFIVGRDKTLKIIFSGYISILTADGLAGIFEKYFVAASPILQAILQRNPGGLIVFKIGVFVFLTVLLSTREIFQIKIAPPRSSFFAVGLTGLCGILSAGLIVSTLLIFVSGFSPVQAAQVAAQNPIGEIAKSSDLVRLMIENYAVWFSMPALALVGASFLNSEN